MGIFRHLLWVCSAALFFASTQATAQITVPQLGRDYTVLERPQPVEAGKRIEVTEFFGYFCPGCHGFEPYFEDWIKKQGDRIVVRRVHTDMHGFVSQQKLFFTLDVMGKVNELQMKAFNAFHVDRNRLMNDADVMKFIDKQNIDKKRFVDVYSSFAVQSKLSRVAYLQNAYRTNGVPTVAIDGRYIVSPADVAANNRNAQGSVHPGIQVMDWLVNKAIQEKEKNNVAPKSK